MLFSSTAPYRCQKGAMSNPVKFILVLFTLVICFNVSNCDDYENYEDYEDYEDYEEYEYDVEHISVGQLTSLTNNKSCVSCNCGIPNRWNRIVGGWMTEVHEYPWMAALSRNGRFFCGGTLINDQYVLTAAHCVVRSGENNTDWVKSSVSVVLAEHNTAEMGETMSEASKVSQVFVHPGFTRATLNHDVALLKLTRKVKFRHGLRTACLPPKDGSYEGEMATVAGWGLTMEGGSTSAYLRETLVPVLSLSSCRKRGYQSSRITENMICAGDYKMMDSCQGDSGGPLMVTNDFKQMMAVGVVSWGEGCARPSKPGVYARVDKHVDWILEQTRDSCYCY